MGEKENGKNIGNGNKDINKEVIAEHFKEILEKGLKLNINDENLIDTPKRFAKSYAEIFSGLSHTKEDIERLFKACFPSDYKGIILEEDISVFSMCPHHFLPIRYEVHIGYIPDGCIVGLSKLPRIVEALAKKPSLQEQFTEDIVNEIDSHVKPKGVICTVRGAHYCMQMRGVKQKDVWTTTSSVRGVFLAEPELELKFYNLLKNKD